MKKEEERPFLLCASFLHPHCPYEITKKYWDMYENMEIPMPMIREKLEEHHVYNQRLQIHHEIDVCALTDEQIKNSRRAYFGMVTYVDDLIGQLMDEMERLEMLDNTVIIFTSDHGDMLGEHNMWFKRTFYEYGAKVPLIIAYPKTFQQNVILSEVVSLVDVAATITDIGSGGDKAEWIDDMDGSSLVPLLSGNDCAWPGVAQFEYYGEGTLTPMIMLRTQKYKYVKVHNCESLLFDLETDPLETNNLAAALPTVAAKFEQDLAWWNGEKIEADVLKSQRQRLLLNKAMKCGVRQDWGYKPEPTYSAKDTARHDPSHNWRDER